MNKLVFWWYFYLVAGLATIVGMPLLILFLLCRGIFEGDTLSFMSAFAVSAVMKLLIRKMGYLGYN